MTHVLRAKAGALRLAFVTAVAALFLTACTVPLEPVSSRSGYAVVGVSGASPNAPGWSRMSLTSTRAKFGLAGPSDVEETIFSTSIDQIASNSGQLSDREISNVGFDNAGAIQRASGQVVISEKRSSTRVNGEACNMLRTVAMDPSSSSGAGGEVPFFKTQLIICRHPKDDTKVVITYFTNRSLSRTVPAAIQALANQYFADIRFTEQGL